MNRVRPSKKILFSLMTVLLFFVTAEIGLRMIGFEFNAVAHWIEQSNQALSRDGWFSTQRGILTEAELKDAQWFLEYDAELLWKTRAPNPHYHINAAGHRGDPVPEKRTENAYRILVLGDSCAWGYGVNYYDTFSFLLEKELNSSRNDHRFRVINAGIPGYSTAQGLRYFRDRLQSMEPDLVIIYFGRNDSRIKPVRWAGKTDTMLLDEMRQVQPLTKLIRKSRVFQCVGFIVGKFRALSREKQSVPGELDEEMAVMHQERLLSDDQKRVPGPEFIDNIRGMISLAESRAASVLLLTIPVNPDTVGNYNRELREISRSGSIPLIDLAKIFAEKDDYKRLLLDECHPSIRGHQLIEEALIAYLITS